MPTKPFDLARSRAVLCHLVLGAALSSPAVFAQDQPASLSGVIESAGQPAQPLPHAVVSLSGPGLDVHISVVADDLGRFRFPDLRPGRYIVTAAKPAYLTSAYGARRPGGPGTPVSLAAGQQVADLRLALARAGVIAGHVRDAAGVPAANIPIVVARADTASAPGTYAPRSDAWITDDRGAFRAHSLAPGEYLVVAAIEETVGNIYRPTVAEIDASMFALRQRLAGEKPEPLSAPDETSAITPKTYVWAPVFYPGTTNASEARRIRVAAGDVREDIDFTIDLAPLLSVAGVVVNADGSAAPASTAIARVGPPLPVFRYSSVTVLPVRKSDGDFRFTSLAPGRYVVRAGGDDGAWAVANVLVSDTDIKDLRLVLQPPMSLSGRLVFETTTDRPPADLTAVRVGLERLELASPTPLSPAAGVSSVPTTSFPPPEPVAAGADGTFAITGILPGVFTVTATVPDAAAVRWWLKSVVANGRDLLDAPLAFGTDIRTVTDAVLTLSNRSAELTGTLQTADGQPAPDYSVVVFSADRAHWFLGSRRTRAARPGSDGVFTVTDLPAGDYLVAALTDAEAGVWDQPAFLEQLAKASLRITMGDGARVRQDLRIAR